MKTEKIKMLLSAGMLTICLIFMADLKVCAESGEEYITITVDAEDDNDNLMYSIDTTDTDAFTSSNTFTIPAGTSHTIYVKDAAGNITAQDYTPQTASGTWIQEDASQDINIDTGTEDETSQDINIDVEIGNKDYSSILGYSPAEPGAGTMHDKTVTDGSDDGAKVFYTVTTAEGDTFYMIIDQNQNTDNVYLLNAVTRADLEALAADDGPEATEDKEEDNLLTALQNEKSKDASIKETASEKDSGMSSKLIMLAVIFIAGGTYYYLKIYKNKKDQQMDIMDAMDMEDFAPEEADDEEEAEFDIADDEKQTFLDNLINEDEDEDDGKELFDTEPDDYIDADSEREAAEEELFAEPDFEADFDPELDGEEDE